MPLAGALFTPAAAGSGPVFTLPARTLVFGLPARSLFFVVAPVGPQSGATEAPLMAPRPAMPEGDAP